MEKSNNSTIKTPKTISLSEELLWNVITETSTENGELRLEAISLDTLQADLDNDTAKKTF